MFQASNFPFRKKLLREASILYGTNGDEQFPLQRQLSCMVGINITQKSRIIRENQALTPVHFPRSFFTFLMIHIYIYLNEK